MGLITFVICHVIDVKFTLSVEFIRMVD
jgi:hypothetical protein